MPNLSSFCRLLPKSELHAHLGGSVSFRSLRSLILSSTELSSTLKEELILRLNASWNASEALSRKVLSEISASSSKQSRTEPATNTANSNSHSFQGDSCLEIGTAKESSLERNSSPGADRERAMQLVFDHFAVLHSVLDNEAALRRAAHDVVLDFAQDCVYYLELRTTPRANLATRMTKRSYVDAVRAGINDALAELQKVTAGSPTPILNSDFDSESELNQVRQLEHEEDAPEPPEMVVRLLLSLDRSEPLEELRGTLDLATDLRATGDVVGVDLSGNPYRGRVEDLESVVREAKRRALPVALHLAETQESVRGTQSQLQGGSAGAGSEAARLLALDADRIGHATFLRDAPALADELASKGTPLEISLSSNEVLQCSSCSFMLSRLLHALLSTCTGKPVKLVDTCLHKTERYSYSTVSVQHRFFCT